jgi:hypothetical protein
MATHSRTRHVFPTPPRNSADWRPCRQPTGCSWQEQPLTGLVGCAEFRAVTCGSWHSEHGEQWSRYQLISVCCPFRKVSSQQSAHACYQFVSCLVPALPTHRWTENYYHCNDILVRCGGDRAEWLDGRNVVVGKLVRGYDLLGVVSERFGSINGVPKEELYIGSCGIDHSKI